MSHFLENVVGALASPERGLFVLSPFLLALVPGIRAAWRDAPPWAQGFALGGVAYTLVQLWLNRFSGGYNFYSYRLMLELLTCATPLLVISFRQWTAKSAFRLRVFAGFLAVSAAMQAMGAVAYRPDFLARDPWHTFQPALVLAERPFVAGGLAAITIALTLLAFAMLRGRAAQRLVVTVPGTDERGDRGDARHRDLGKTLPDQLS
jgi:hypothetical protein